MIQHLETMVDHGLTIRDHGWPWSNNQRPWFTMVQQSEIMVDHGPTVSNHGWPWSNNQRPWLTMIWESVTMDNHGQFNDHGQPWSLTMIDDGIWWMTMVVHGWPSSTMKNGGPWLGFCLGMISIRCFNFCFKCWLTTHFRLIRILNQIKVYVEIH